MWDGVEEDCWYNFGKRWWFQVGGCGFQRSLVDIFSRVGIGLDMWGMERGSYGCRLGLWFGGLREVGVGEGSSGRGDVLQFFQFESIQLCDF